MQDEQTDVEQHRQQVQINQLKAELEVMLKRPLLPAGFSPAYPTFGGHQVSIGMPHQLVKDCLQKVIAIYKNCYIFELNNILL